ncbi:MAG: hypothetical protein CMH55_07695 [Myxococcales bacterium]|nr:hypothetical protein [Myxococcales bacterium]
MGESPRTEAWLEAQRLRGTLVLVPWPPACAKRVKQHWLRVLVLELRWSFGHLELLVESERGGEPWWVRKWEVPEELREPSGPGE